MNKTRLMEVIDFALTNPKVEDVSAFLADYLEDEGVVSEDDQEPSQGSGYRLKLHYIPGRGYIDEPRIDCSATSTNPNDSLSLDPKSVKVMVDFDEVGGYAGFKAGTEEENLKWRSWPNDLEYKEGVDLIIKDSIRRSKVIVGDVDITSAVSHLSFEVSNNGSQPYAVLYCPIRRLRMDVEAAILENEPPIST